MKIKHKVPPAAYRPETVSPEYQAEIDATSARLAAAHEAAQRRLAAAENKLARAKLGDRTARRAVDAAARLRDLAELVERRRAELAEIESLMKASPQSAAHRGTKSFRPVPNPGGPL